MDERKIREEVAIDLERQFFLISWKQFSLWGIGGLVAIIIGGNVLIFNATKVAASKAIEQLMTDVSGVELKDRLRNTREVESELKNLDAQFRALLLKASNQNWQVNTISTKGHSISGCEITCGADATTMIVEVGENSSGFLFLSTVGAENVQQWQVAFVRGKKMAEFHILPMSLAPENSTAPAKLRFDNETNQLLLNSTTNVDATVTALYSGRIAFGRGTIPVIEVED